jgi:hypothetical protein
VDTELTVGLVVRPFELDRGHEPQRRVPADAVVEHLQVLEPLGPRLVAGREHFPPPGRRRDSASSRASTTSRLSIVAAIDQPTIMRLNRSSTTARYSHPSRVGIYVMSAHHDAFGPEGSKSRSRTFGATGRRWLESVVRTNRRGIRALTPWALMSLATVFSEHAWPRAFNSAAIRGLP